jgi:amino acid adenylation domain-containing protein
MKTMQDRREADESSVPLTIEDEVYVFPLSFAQQRLWVLDRLEPNSSVYNLPIPLRLKGKLKVDALRDSLTAILRRHEVLNSTFGERDGTPVQIVPVSAAASLAFTDLSGFPVQEREAKARDIAKLDARKPFDLSRGPVFRSSLVKLDEQDHVLLLTPHHIVFDGWSRGVLLKELLSHYAAFVNRQPVSLPEVAIQYSDYAIWQRENLRGEKLAKQSQYWREQLAGAPAGLDLPIDHPRPPLQTFNGGQYPVLLSRTLQDSLNQLSRQENTTFFMTLLAAFNVLLARYSGQEDVVIGTPIAGRNRAELESLIGFFVNTLALRTNVSGEPTFRQLLSRVRETCLKAYAHQDLPFEKLVEELKPERDTSRNPMFQVMFALQNVPVEESKSSAGLVIERFNVGEGTTSKFEISLFAIEGSNGLRLCFEYNTDLFKKATIVRMAQHFQTLLESIVVDASRPISELPWFSQAERQQVLIDFNRTELDYDRDLGLHQLFEQQAERTPTAPALVFGEEQLSYAELNRRANQLARYLRNRGVGVESRVGLYLERSPEMLVALLGVLKAGAAYVPLDPAYPSDRIAFIVEDAQLPLLLTEERLVAQLSAHAAPVVRLDADWPNIASEPGDNLAVEVRPRNLAYVLYTSGSTGKPKGVQIEHGNVVNFLCSMQREPGLTADDVLLAVTTLSFDIAGLELYLPLTVGARIVLATREQAVDGSQLQRLLTESRISTMQATPATWRLLIESGWTGKADLKVLCGGEALPRELAEQLLPRCAELWNMYGPTETTIWSSVFRVRDTKWTMAPIGRSIANTQMYVLDKHLRPLPIGVVGELYIGGDGLARGYLNRPELTSERFVPSPFSADLGDRLYRTGDLVRYRSDGNLIFLGRIDNQIKVRGFRIELGEIESVLSEHPAVKQSVVIAREDVAGGQQLVGYVIPDVTKAAVFQNLIPELRKWLSDRLPNYMVPSAIVALDGFPLTPNGKVDRRALPVPHVIRHERTVPPRDQLERMLVGLWEKLLAVKPISVTDNFFELGGHSLLAVRLMREIQAVTGKALPLATLFEGATIEYLAGQLRQGGQYSEEIVVEIQGSGSNPPFFGIVTPGMNALGYIALARNLGPNQPLYKIQAPGARMRGRCYSPTDFEDLAAEYIKAMKTVQPQGPYYLGGMCEGARIAFDMARQLEARNEKVGLLAIFDTWVLENSQIRFLWKVDYYWGRLKRFKMLSFERKCKYLAGWFSRRAKSASQEEQGEGLPKGIDWPTAFWPGKDFVPAKFGGKITVFKNPKQPYFYVRDPLMGWGTRSTVDVELHEVNTRHGFFMREPYVRELAQRLSQCLYRSRSESSQPKNRLKEDVTTTRLVLSGEQVSS